MPCTGVSSANEPITIHRAAERTGWSARMLRYVERLGLVAPSRSGSGYRLYGPGDVHRLLTLRELLLHFELDLSEVAFAKRMLAEPELGAAIEQWLDSQPCAPSPLMTTTTEAA
jgi:MerR family transcriptional regulator, copper efflux regulator